MGASKHKAGRVLTFAPYALDELSAIGPFSEPHPSEAFVLLWLAVVRTEEKSVDPADLDVWIDLRRKLRPLEHRMESTGIDENGEPKTEESIVLRPEGGDLTLTAAELAMVQRLWQKYRAKMPLAMGERRALVDELVGLRKSKPAPDAGGES